ncbi:MAG TPA: PQQ-dependent sugar dehydrogenase, partial [Acidimicrobiia bacterium]|nr:PQQ-dependent sugar dehydrogenase [Acidimicrobiia bacterium]
MRRLAVVLLLVFLAAACSGDDDDNDTAASTRPSTTTAASTAPVDSTSPTTASPPADLEAASLTLAEVASALDSPVALAWRAGDDRMYVAEQSGAVRIVEDGAPLDRPVLEVDVATGGNEQGLLGLTFSADGTKLYVDYTDPDGNTHVDEYTMNGDVADTGSRRELLAVDQPFANHNGGDVIFGPDGMLYITLGDGGSAGDPQQRAQNLDELLGKILRIDPAPASGAEYTIPPDNPFVGRSGARPEIWMWGLRNPWRFS